MAFRNGDMRGTVSGFALRIPKFTSSGNAPLEEPRLAQDDHGDIPITRGLYGDGIDCRPWCAMQLTHEQLRILQDIHATKPVTEEEANWAVRTNYAAQGEDGDIALSPQGIRLIEDEAK